MRSKEPDFHGTRLYVKLQRFQVGIPSSPYSRNMWVSRLKMCCLKVESSTKGTIRPPVQNCGSSGPVSQPDWGCWDCRSFWSMLKAWQGEQATLLPLCLPSQSFCLWTPPSQSLAIQTLLGGRLLLHRVWGQAENMYVVSTTSSSHHATAVCHLATDVFALVEGAGLTQEPIRTERTIPYNICFSNQVPHQSDSARVIGRERAERERISACAILKFCPLCMSPCILLECSARSCTLTQKSWISQAKASCAWCHFSSRFWDIQPVLVKNMCAIIINNS